MRLPGRKSCFIAAASGACALDTVPRADRSHWTALLSGWRAAQGGSLAHTTVLLPGAMAGNRAVQGCSLVHTVETTALVPLVSMAGSKAALALLVAMAGSRAAGTVR